jgi:membrane protease YdiL (CAAX protease family)
MLAPRSAPWVIPLALAPMLLQSLADGLYKGPLHHWWVSAFWLADIAKFVVVPVFILWCLARFAGVRPRHYGLHWPQTPEERERLLGGTLMACVVLVPLFFAVQQIQWRLGYYAMPAFGYEETLPDGRVGRWLVIGYYALTAGIVEEIVFRGLPWAWVQQFRDTRAARAVWVVATSIVFALVHWENGGPGMLAAGAYGIGAALLYLKLRNLWPLVVAHVVTDIISFA